MTRPAVFDCMIFVQGAGRPNGPAHACIHLVTAGKVTLYMSADILAEVRDVLARPKIRKKFPSLTPERIGEFVQNVESNATVIGAVAKVYTLGRDPKDEPYLNLAPITGAQYLVSRDKDLLDLMNDKTFRERFAALTILDPQAFLHAIAADEKASAPTKDES